MRRALYAANPFTQELFSLYFFVSFNKINNTKNGKITLNALPIKEDLNSYQKTIKTNQLPTINEVKHIHFPHRSGLT